MRLSSQSFEMRISVSFDPLMKPPENLRCLSKHIDSHLKPFRCRKPGCANQAFSSVACRLRHEREMHKMHNAEEFLCRYDGPCERKQPGNGFARSFNRGDHEKRVHHIFQENPRTKGRPKGPSSVTNNTNPSPRRPSAQRRRTPRDNNSPSDESSTSTIGATDSNRLAQVDGPLAATHMDPMDPYAGFLGFHGGASVGNPPNATLSIMENQVILSSRDAKRAGSSKTGVKPKIRGASQISKERQELERQWAEHVHELRNLMSCLPDAPDESSGNVLCSIDQETRALQRLRDIHNKINLRKMGNSRTW
jgi:hypothetical protein